MHHGPVRTDVFAARSRCPTDRCEHCDVEVERVWLVPGDVLNSCHDCYRSATGAAPRHELGHTSPPPPPRPYARASFHQRVDGRRPA